MTTLLIHFRWKLTSTRRIVAVAGDVFLQSAVPLLRRCEINCRQTNGESVQAAVVV